jgi:Na+-translocating ferredoxin:NAD+ oxidoreductase RnfD subunit
MYHANQADWSACHIRTIWHVYSISMLFGHCSIMHNRQIGWHATYVRNCLFTQLACCSGLALSCKPGRLVGMPRTHAIACLPISMLLGPCSIIQTRQIGWHATYACNCMFTQLACCSGLAVSCKSGRLVGMPHTHEIACLPN